MDDPDPTGSKTLARLRQGLEPAQVAVLEHDFGSQGPLLVLAGAGTGKTTTLTRRLSLELARQTPAQEIMALTFTRKAAAEMAQRVGDLQPPGATIPEIRTFHSLGLALLSENEGQGWKAAGWSSPPKLLAEGDESKASADFWQARFRNNTQTPPSAHEWTRLMAEWGDPDRYHASGGGRAVEPWREWEAWKRRLGIAEMHDLISGALLALERDSPLAKRWQARARTLFVDEYQDTDRTQYRLIKKLSNGSPRLMAVGDDDQAIYGFRGADIRNILEWKSDLPDGRILSLTGNHRSFSPVLDATNRLFPDKPEAFRKRLVARRSKPRAPLPIWFQAHSPKDENAWIRTRLEAEIRGGRKAADLCVLFRSHREEIPLRKALWGLPLAQGEADGIRLSTIHAAKGLEWPVVVVYSQDRPATDGKALIPFARDEERRLFYVACTRARDQLYLTSCQTRPKNHAHEFRIPHPWMDLIETCVRIRPTWFVGLLRRFWEPAVRRSLQE